MTLRQDTTKIDIIRDAYLNAVLFFWNRSDDIEPFGEEAKEYFNAYYDSFKEVEVRFEGDDFKSEADRDAVANELEQLYYMIVHLDASSPVLHMINPVIEMIENNESQTKLPRDLAGRKHAVTSTEL